MWLRGGAAQRLQEIHDLVEHGVAREDGSEHEPRRQALDERLVPLFFHKSTLFRIPS